MILEECNVDDTLLEDTPLEDLRLHLTQLRRQLWDEEHFTDKTCRKLSTLPHSERSSLASLLVASRKRQDQLKKLDRRLQLLVNEKAGIL